MPNKIFARISAHRPAFKRILSQLAARELGDLKKINELNRSLVAVTVKAPLPLLCTIVLDCNGPLTPVDQWHSVLTEDPDGWTHKICANTSGMFLHALAEKDMIVKLFVHGVAPPLVHEMHDLVFCSSPEAAQVVLTPGTPPGWVKFEYNDGPAYSVNLTEYVIQS